MNHITYRISLDMRQTESNVVVKMKRDDTIKKLAISLTDGGKPYHITEECRAVFAGKKPDGTILLNPCSIEDCVVTYEVTLQTEAVLGEVKSEIRLYGAEGELGSSPSFTVLIVPPIYDAELVIESHDEVNALTDLITGANSTIQKGKEVAQRGEAIFASLHDKEEELDARAEEVFGDLREAKETLVSDANRIFNGFQDKQEELVAEAEKAFGNMSKTYVSLTSQKLTDAQKKQARENVDAASASDLKELTNSTIKKDTEASVSSLKIHHSPETSDAIFAEGTTVSDKDDLLVNALTLRGDFEGGIDNDSVILRNVHAGENSTDAVNLAQVKEMVGGNKVYEHIATITVAPDADGSLPQHVIFSADSNGNAFELSDFIIKANAGFVDGAQSTLYMNINKDAIITNGKVDSIGTTCRGFNIFFRKEPDGCWRAEHTASMANTHFYNAQSCVAQSRLIPTAAGHDFSKITSIDIFTSTGTNKQWVEGSTFELWGVRV